MHYGQAIADAIRNSGHSVKSVAEAIGMSRNRLHQLFKKPEVPLDVILAIGKAIKYDFTPEIPEFKAIVHSHIENHPASEYQLKYHECRDKLLEVMERYSMSMENLAKLLKENQELRDKLNRLGQ